MFTGVMLAGLTNGGIIGIVFAAILVFIILITLISSIRIVNQTDKLVIERLGKYLATWDTGVHFLVPFIDRVQKKVSMKEQIYDFPPQPVITKDNVTMQIDTVVFFSVTDPKLYTYGVENPIVGIEALSATTLRNIIGDLDLDDTLTSRDIINTKMRQILDEATDPWGIKVTRVEVKNILPPKDIQNAMEKQMRAEREKREKILIAEGEKTSAITIAEGNKEAAILNAEAEKQALIKKAEAQAESILKVKEAEAQGELLVRKAEAEAVRMINEAAPSSAVLTLKYYEALAKVADGKATKLIVPSNLASLSSSAAALTEVVEGVKREPVAEKPAKKEMSTTEKLQAQSKASFDASEADVHAEMERDHR
jgi:regulator of protease activity HflC (stomatin/prohibitin superfamily)